MNHSLDEFVYCYHNGCATQAFAYLGCHAELRDGAEGFVFRVWAPHARWVSVVGDFNFWNPEDLPMHRITEGIWEAWSSFAQEGQAYKFYVVGAHGSPVYKVDPLAFRTRLVPDTSSVIWKQGKYRRIWSALPYMNDSVFRCCSARL